MPCSYVKNDNPSYREFLVTVSMTLLCYQLYCVTLVLLLLCLSVLVQPQRGADKTG